MTVSRLENGEPVSIETALRALSECGYAVAVVPESSRLTLEDTGDPADRPTEPPEPVAWALVVGE